MLKLRQLFFSCNATRRGSSLIGALVMVAILSLVVGVMLSSSRSAVRSSRDRILYEEAYQAAISGTHVARAWLIDPDLATSMNKDGSIKSQLESLVTKAISMNKKIQTDVKNNNTTNMTGSQRYSNEGFSLGSTLSEGRRLLLDLPLNNGRIVNFVNDARNKNFTDNLFNGSKPASGYKNYVDMVRITTPPNSSSTTASLRQVTFVIESRGIAEYGGIKKERIVQQRVLIYPNEPEMPLLGASEAILTQGGLTIGGSSHANVHWAPVLSKGNIDMPFLKQITKSGTGNSTKYTLDTRNNTKFNAAGTYSDDPLFGNSNVMDSWLRWMAGKNGKLVANGGNLFANLPSDIGDFFGSAANNSSDQTRPSMSNVILGGYYAESGTSMANPNGIYVTKDGVTTGSLVQGSDWVDQRVDSFFNQMNYAQLKAYAQTHNGYYYYDNGKLYNAAGVEKTLTAMTPPSTPFDPLKSDLSDRILFIDSKQNLNSTSPTNPFSGSFDLPQFWKGVVYVNGNVSASGAGSSPDMVIRTPDQFATFRKDGTSGSYTTSKFVLDGILVCQGVATFRGNTSIYGTLAAKNGVDFGGTPRIFYNSMNGEGRLKDDSAGYKAYRVMAGRLVETAAR